MPNPTRWNPPPYLPTEAQTWSSGRRPSRSCLGWAPQQRRHRPCKHHLVIIFCHDCINCKSLHNVIYSRMANSDDRDGFGIIVTYVIKMRLFLGALAGELVGELPIILMHPKVNNHCNWFKAVISITTFYIFWFNSLIPRSSRKWTALLTKLSEPLPWTKVERLINWTASMNNRPCDFLSDVPSYPTPLM